MNPTSALILSDKSSGSSVLQRELARHSAVSIMRKPQHQEDETLYWSKAAAVLGLDQPPMIDSTILPMEREVALDSMETLLADNLPEPIPAPQSRSEIFSAWEQLAVEYGPVFLEKSPHHLHNVAVLQLLLAAQDATPDVDFRFIGLVRNPVDTMYSMWTRWRTPPEAREGEWCRAYSNLQWLSEQAPEHTHVIRYEDLTGDPGALRDLFGFLGVEPETGAGETLHRRSVQAWRNDRGFGYQPSEQVRRIAASFGYAEDDLANPHRLTWPLRRTVLSTGRSLRTAAGRARRLLRR
ncbi:MAG: sulfotransferase [Acidimicrobiia bacterium]|nr:sulfotransferase [Acidimicrobiia bacterium]